MAVRKIPKELEPEIIARTAQGASARQIADWLLADHGVSVKRQSVLAFLHRTGNERAEVAKAVVREVLTRTVTSDLEHLEEIRNELRERRKKAAEALDALVRSSVDPEPPEGKDPKVERRRLYTEAMIASRMYTKIIELEIKCLDRRLHYSGADNTDESQRQQPAVHVFLPEDRD